MPSATELPWPQPLPPPPPQQAQITPGWRRPSTIFHTPSASTSTTALIMPDPAVSPRTSLTHNRRHSRRSTGTLTFTQTSLSPLTSTALTEHDFRRKERRGREGSYIQGLSAPSTPGILSRTHSQKNSYVNLLPKSKSSSQLPGASEWFLRTGAALTSETREVKGQSWLVSRASSTSLVGDEDQDEVVPEARIVGRGSGGYTSEELEEVEDGDYFSRVEGLQVQRELEQEGGSEGEEEEEEEEGEEEIDIPRGFGLGQFVDRMIGWTVFADDDTDDEESLDGYEEETLAKKPRFSGQSVGFDTADEDKLREQRRIRDGDEGWQDPAWVFSIASRVFL